MSPLHSLYCFIILIVGRLAYVLEPHGISVDEFTYLATAEAWTHYGRLYVDAIDRKPPLLYGLYALIGSFCGQWNIHAIHLFYLLMTFAFCLIAEKISQLLENPPPKGLTAIVYAIISSSFPREFISCNSELALLLPLGIAFLILLDPKKIERSSPGEFFFWIFLAGGLTATATLCKEIALLPFAFTCTSLFIVLLIQKAYQRSLLLVISALFGLGTVYALTCLKFYLAGSLDDFIFWNWTDNVAYIQQSFNAEDLSRPILEPLLAVIAAWPVYSLAFFLWYKKAATSRASLQTYLLLGAVLGAFACIYVSGRLFAHYFVPLSWFLAIASSRGISELLQTKVSKRWTILGLAIPFVFFFLLTTFRDQLISVSGFKGRSHTFDLRTQDWISRFSHYVKSQTQPTDRIVVWGMASQIYALSERGSGTRFIPADYVSGRMGGYASGVKQPNPRAMGLYLEDLENKKPRLFIDTSTAALNDYQYFPLTDYPLLLAYLNTHYIARGAVDKFGIWERKD